MENEIVEYASANDRRIAETEAEIKRLEEERERELNPEAFQEKEDENKPVEEPKHVEPEAPVAPTDSEDWKKRYSDLRRYVEKELKPTFQTQINDLKRQLNEVGREQMTLPKTDEEIDSWAQEYPDLFAVVKTVAAKMAKEATGTVEERLKEVETERLIARREKAEAQLLKAHPDLYDLRDSVEFHEWVREKGDWIEEALYHNIDNWRKASDAIQLYKVEKGLVGQPKTKSNKEVSQDAAKAVPVSSRKEEPQEKSKFDFRESEIERMSKAQLEQNWDAIMKARKTGRILYDLSGAAR